MDPGVVARVVFLVVCLGVVVGGVGGVGFALGRLLGRREGRHAPLPDDPGRRLRLMEEELEEIQSEVAKLQEQRDFDRLLRPGEDPEKPRGHRDAA